MPNESLRIRADTNSAFAGSTLTIRIEEPAPEMLFVRFTYDVCGLEEVRDEHEDNARCSAYQCWTSNAFARFAASSVSLWPDGSGLLRRALCATGAWVARKVAS